jgi:hypothetical protein
MLMWMRYGCDTTSPPCSVLSLQFREPLNTPLLTTVGTL